LLQCPDHLRFRVPALRHTLFPFLSQKSYLVLCGKRGAGQGNPEASQIEEGAVSGEEMLMTDQQASELTEPRIGSLHNLAAFVPPQFATIFVAPSLMFFR